MRCERVRVFDAFGQMIFDKKCQSQFEFNVDVSRWPRGIYQALLSGDDQQGVIRFVLN